MPSWTYLPSISKVEDKEQEIEAPPVPEAPMLNPGGPDSNANLNSSEFLNSEANPDSESQVLLLPFIHT